MPRIVKPSRRRNRVFQADPEGRVIEALGRRPPPLAMRRHRGAPPSQYPLSQKGVPWDGIAGSFG